MVLPRVVTCSGGQGSPRELYLSDVEGRPQPAACARLSGRETRAQVGPRRARTYEGKAHGTARATHTGTRQRRRAVKIRDVLINNRKGQLELVVRSEEHTSELQSR